LLIFWIYLCEQREQVCNLQTKSVTHYWVNYKYQPKHKETVDIKKLMESIKLLIDNDKFITIREIVNKLNDQFKKKFSNSLVYAVIVRQLGYSYKKVSEKLYSKNVSELLKRKKKFKKTHKDYKNIICIDETYIHSNIHMKYGWSKKGVRLEHYVKYSIIVAISRNGIEHHKIFKENVKKDTYLQFITELAKMHTGKKFLMDNDSFHKCK